MARTNAVRILRVSPRAPGWFLQVDLATLADLEHHARQEGCVGFRVARDHDGRG
jgi:hypothetical protein